MEADGQRDQCVISVATKTKKKKKKEKYSLGGYVEKKNPGWMIIAYSTASKILMTLH